ncbi:MAG: Myxococcus phage Mx8 [Pseudomonadota bacterium]
MARYILDFGSANAGLAPTFTDFVDADTWVALTQPTISEAPPASGAYYFDYDWTLVTTTSIWYKATVAGVELSDTINANTVAAATGAGSTGAASVGWLWTAGNLLNTTAVELGLDEVADPYASTDRNFVQLRTLLRSVGHELWMAREWKALVKEASYTGDGVNSLFNLPADFGRMCDDSGWNRTTTTPFDLMSSPRWQALQAWTSVADLSVMYRIVGNRIQFYTVPTSGDVLYHDYVSRYWVASDGATTGDLYEPTVSGDRILLEPTLVKAALKVKWLDAKGRDSTAARLEYYQAFEGAASNEPAQLLYMGAPPSDFKRISGANVPDTGYGP